MKIALRTAAEKLKVKSTIIIAWGPIIPDRLQSEPRIYLFALQSLCAATESSGDGIRLRDQHPRPPVINRALLTSNTTTPHSRNSNAFAGRDGRHLPGAPASRIAGSHHRYRCESLACALHVDRKLISYSQVAQYVCESLRMDWSPPEAF